ncbi:MAG: OsmC family protein [Polyangiaceae bacterium]|nr:OsmC family protein [Polyangiaceae bacterium]
MSDVMSHFDIQVRQISGFEFAVRFDKAAFATLALDEPPPLGHDRAPNAARVLAAAIGNCLAASLVFCTKRAGTMLENVTAEVGVDVVRNADKRLRIGQVRVHLDTGLPNDHPAIAGCLDKFEDFCMVTQSVRQGIDVAVTVGPRTPAG